MATLSRRSWTTKAGEARTGYEVEWIGPAGKRRRRLFSGIGAQKAAKALRALVETDPAAAAAGDAGQDQAPAAADATVAQACDAWIKSVKARGRGKATWSKYEQHRDNHIVQATIPRDGVPVEFGSLPAASIDGPDCEALKEALLAKLSGAMARRVMASVRMMFAQAARAGTVTASPARETRVVVSGRKPRRIRIPEKPAIRTILETAGTEAPAPPTFTEVWTNLGIFAGPRPSELRGLALEDLVFAGRNPGLHIRRKADERGILGATKTENGDRFITLGPQLIALLKRWLLTVPRSSALPDPARPGETIHLLLPTSIGTAQTHANVTNRMWVPLCQAAGLTRKAKSRAGETILRPLYPLNCLRHIHASLLIEQAMMPKQVQLRMGHATIQITYDLYGHLFDQRDADRKVSARLERDLLG